MKTIQFTKSSTHHLLSHIYEHLFFIHLDTILRSEGLFDIVDYTLGATTHNGNITLSLEVGETYDTGYFINKASQDFLSIPELLDIAISQIECEYKSTLEIDYELLQAQLIELNAISWYTKEKYQPSISCCAVSLTPRETSRLTLGLDYKTKDSNVWLLYRQVAGVIMNNLLNDIADTYGGFVESTPYHLDIHNDISGIMSLPCDSATSQKLLSLYDELSREMASSQAYVRLMTLLHHSSRLEPAPTDGAGTVVSEQLWRKIATQHNLELILQNISLRISI